MNEGIILNKAASECRGSSKKWLIIIGICLLIMAMNYGYFLNLASGPMDVSEINLDKPGIWNYGTAEGPFFPIASNQLAIKVLGQTADTGKSLGTYYATRIKDRLLVIYSEKSDLTASISGKLSPLDSDIKELIGDDNSFYKYMLSDYVSYAWSMNLPLLISFVILPIAIIMFLFASKKSGNPYAHKQIAKLKAIGEPSELLLSIEKNNTSPTELPILTTDDFLVVLQDRLRIYKLSDIDGFGTQTNSPIFSITFFVKGNMISDAVFLPKGTVEPVMERLMTLIPDKYVSNIEEFEKSWKS